MPKNVTIMGATFSDVPAVTLPQAGGGTARFTDTSPTTAGAVNVENGKVFIDAAGNQITQEMAHRHPLSVSTETSISNLTEVAVAALISRRRISLRPLLRRRSPQTAVTTHSAASRSTQFRLERQEHRPLRKGLYRITA